MVLFTDGVTEATDRQSRPFGFERLCAAVAEVGTESAEHIVDHLIAQVTGWSPVLADDVSVMALRYRR